jgi:hypothetical protein
MKLATMTPTQRKHIADPSAGDRFNDVSVSELECQLSRGADGCYGHDAASLQTLTRVHCESARRRSLK